MHLPRFPAWTKLPKWGRIVHSMRHGLFIAQQSPRANYTYKYLLKWIGCIIGNTFSCSASHFKEQEKGQDSYFALEHIHLWPELASVWRCEINPGIVFLFLFLKVPTATLLWKHIVLYIWLWNNENDLTIESKIK